MRGLKIILSLAVVSAIALITIQSQVISDFTLSTFNWGWMASYLFPRVLTIALGVWLALISISFINGGKLLKLGLGTLVVGLCIGGYLMINLPYLDDWNRTGSELSEEELGSTGYVEDFLNNQFNNYEGIVCLALPDCPHCISSMPKLEKLQSRVNDLNVSVLVFADDSTGLQRFSGHVGPTGIPVFLAPNPKESYVLSRGRFPSFLYLRNGKIVHRWRNGQFGYPAMDWVESKLN